jgi:uncharacterized protein (DUF58 family)
MTGRLQRGAAFWRRLRYPPVGHQHGRQERLANRFPLVHGLYYWLTAHTTLRLYLTVLVGAAPTAFLMLTEFVAPLFVVGFAVIAWIAACMALGLVLCPRLDVTCRMPTRVECGCAFETRYLVRNTGRRTARSIGIETLIYSGWTHLRLRRAALGALGPGEEETVSGGGRALARGIYTLPALRWDSDFPGGFWRWGRTDRVERVLYVHPRYTRLESLDMPLGPRNRHELSAAMELSREAFEFHGCREYREGDALRHVHPRSSARLGAPVVKEFQSEGRSRTAVLVDTRRPLSGRWRDLLPRSSPFEAALALTAAIVEALSVTDRVLELLIAGPEVYRFVSAGRVGYFEDVLDILSGIESCREDPLDKLEPLLFGEIRLIQSVCLVLTGWDARRAALVDELEAWEVGLKIVLITPDGRRPDGLPPGAQCLGARAVLRGETTAV